MNATLSPIVEESLHVLSALVLEDGRLWGEAAEPWQKEDAIAVLDPESDTPNHFLTRSRGSSKTSDLAAIATSILLTQAPERARCYGLAADREQGKLLLNAFEGFVRRTVELAGAFDLQADRIIARHSGASLEILPADAASSWGLLPYFIVVDELAGWYTTQQPRRLWEAVSTAAVKRKECRMVVLTTAGDPAHWSYGILKLARIDPLWHTHEISGPSPWIDARRLEGERRRLTEASYRRLFLNEWTEGDERLTSLGDLELAQILDGPQAWRNEFPYAIGVDLATKRDRTAVAVCHAEPVLLRQDDEVPNVRVALDRMSVWQGRRDAPVNLTDVEAWIEQASLDYRAPVILDPYQGVLLAQRLRARGIPVTEFNFTSQSVGVLASTLYQLIRNRCLALPKDDPELIDELANVRLRETSPGVFRLDHDPDKHDDRAIAIALAAEVLMKPPPRTFVYETFDPAPISQY